VGQGEPTTNCARGQDGSPANGLPTPRTSKAGREGDSRSSGERCPQNENRRGGASDTDERCRGRRRPAIDGSARRTREDDRVEGFRCGGRSTSFSAATRCPGAFTCCRTRGFGADVHHTTSAEFQPGCAPARERGPGWMTTLVDAGTWPASRQATAAFVWCVRADRRRGGNATPWPLPAARRPATRRGTCGGTRAPAVPFKRRELVQDIGLYRSRCNIKSRNLREKRHVKGLYLTGPSAT